MTADICNSMLVKRLNLNPSQSGGYDKATVLPKREKQQIYFTLLCTYPLQIHRLHRHVHAFHNVGHATGYLPHRDGCLHPATDCVNARGQLQQVELLVLFADRILCVDLGDITMTLLDCLNNPNTISILLFPFRSARRGL